MNKSILLVLCAFRIAAFGTDPDIQKALDDAVKLYPPGDYKNVIPPVPSQDTGFHIRILKNIERSVDSQLLPPLDLEPTRLHQTSPERLTDNPFQRPVKLF